MTWMGPTIQYTEQIYFPGADNFETFQEGNDVQTMQYSTSELNKAHNLWQSANERVNARQYHEREWLKKFQSATEVDKPMEHDLEDIEAFF